MPRWLSDAAGVFRRGPSAAPVEFSVRCACGEPVTGVRTATYQECVCGRCGQRLFILPASVYPPVRASKPPADAPVKPRKAGTSAKRSRSESRTPPAVPQRGAGDRLAELRQRAQSGLKRLFTPVRLVLLAMGLVLLATGSWIVHSRALAQARVTLAEATKKGRDALENQEYHVAADEFERACQALDLLGRDDAEARSLRQARRESAVACQLAPHSLFELVGEAIQTRDHPGGLDWSEAFRGTYQGTWVILDTTALLPANRDDKRANRLDVSLVVQGEPVALLADFRAFEHLLIDAQPRRVVFAAQLDDCRPTQTATPGWELVFKSETAFLWSDATLYRGLGFGSDDPADEEAFTQTLATQTRLLGIEP